MSCVYSLAHSIDHLNLLKFWNKNLDTHQRFITLLLLLFILAFNQREEKNPKREIILVNDEKN
jgi:hypothetical protein